MQAPHSACQNRELGVLDTTWYPGNLYERESQRASISAAQLRFLSPRAKLQCVSWQSSQTEFPLEINKIYGHDYLELIAESPLLCESDRCVTGDGR
jgi:hypothetical protein